jgi:hypothetical protein
VKQSSLFVSRLCSNQNGIIAEILSLDDTETRHFFSLFLRFFSAHKPTRSIMGCTSFADVTHSEELFCACNFRAETDEPELAGYDDNSSFVNKRKPRKLNPYSSLTKFLLVQSCRKALTKAFELEVFSY